MGVQNDQLTVIASGFFITNTNICMVMGCGIRRPPGPPGLFIVTLPQPKGDLGNLLVEVTVDNGQGFTAGSDINILDPNEIAIVTTDSAGVLTDVNFSFIIRRQANATPINVFTGAPPV